MKLTSTEQDMLDGKHGAAVRDAMTYQLKVGKFWDAERFVAITNAHITGDIEVMGDGGMGYLERTCAQKAHCIVPTSTNARCMDFAHATALGQDPIEIAKERKIIGFLKDLDVVTANTCINYQILYQPHFREHVAWGDTGTVIYANSVFGARSNFEGGPSALAAAITGRTPEYGFHLDRHRKGTVLVRLDSALADVADWGAVGKIVGQKHPNYLTVPVFSDFKGSVSNDQLKHLGCALASYGSMAMFHMVGVTPEAPTLDTAFAGTAPIDEIVITDVDIERVYTGYDLGDGSANLVVFSAPQLSLYEMKSLSEMFAGRRIASGTQVFVTTAGAVRSDSEKLGYVKALEDAGATIMEDVCFYILQNLPAIRRMNGWTNLISNSAKIVNIIGSHGFNGILRRTAACVDIACSARIAGGRQ